MLYVANKNQSGLIDIVKFKQGDSGLTDINVPQFIWNPTENETTVIAIYLSENGNPATRKLGCKPDEELLKRLLQQKSVSNNTMLHAN